MEPENDPTVPGSDVSADLAAVTSDSEATPQEEPTTIHDTAYDHAKELIADTQGGAGGAVATPPAAAPGAAPAAPFAPRPEPGAAPDPTAEQHPMAQMERILANMPPEHQAAAHEAMQVLDHHLNATDEWMGQVQKYGQWLEKVCSDPKFVAAMEHVTGQKYGAPPGTAPDAQPAGQPAPPALAALPEGTTFETDTEKLLYEQAEASRKVIEQQQTTMTEMGKVVEELRAHQRQQTQQGYHEMQGHFASVVNKLETEFKQHYPGIFQNEQSVTAWRRQATVQLMTILEGQNVKPTDGQIAEAMTQAARILNYPQAQQQGARRGARAQRQATASATSRGGGRAPLASVEPATTLAETAAQMAAGGA